METEIKSAVDEVQCLQSCINDLIGVQALAAFWSVQEPSQIVGTLLEVLVRILRLDFAYARACASTGGSPIEAVRLAQCQTPHVQAQQVGGTLAKWPRGQPTGRSSSVANLFGEGKISITPFRLGLREEIGLVVAGSQRSDFPTETEMLLLRVAANQAAIRLQEARLLSDQRRAADELERRVAERTAQTDRG